MGITITVLPNQTEYFAGDVVKGVVSLNVSDSKGTAAGDFNLELVGTAFAQVVYTEGSGDHQSTRTVKSTKDIFRFTAILASFGGKVDGGIHEFGFAVLLPSSLPSTMKESQNGRDYCSIKYDISACLHRPGILKFDKKGENQIKVSASTRFSPPTPVMGGPSTQVVKKCCCINAGSMSIGFQADHSVASRNKGLGLTVVARNDSSAAVHGLHIEIFQEAAWAACGHTSHQRRVVASVVVPGSQLGNVGQGVRAGNERRKSLVRVAAEAQTELQNLLTSSAGVRHELTVSQCSLVTMDIGIIKVRHWLSVSLKTPTCVTNPEVSIPLTVQDMPVGTMLVEGSNLPSYIDNLQRSPAEGVNGYGQPSPSYTQAPGEADMFQVNNALPTPSAPSDDNSYPQKEPAPKTINE